jgi:N-acetylneuraminic acid mutarotase
MPNKIDRSAIVCTDNYVFSIGGYDEAMPGSINAAYRAPISSDGSIGAWTQISNLPIVASSAQSAIAGNKIYFIGGWNKDNGALNSVYSATFTSGITDYTPYYTDQSSASTTSSSPVKESAGKPWQSQNGFNPSTQDDITGWASTNNLTTDLGFAAILVTKNHMYVLGGNSSNGGTLDTIQSASFDSNGNLTSTWSNVGTLPMAMQDMGYVATKGRFYLVNGNSSSKSPAHVYSVPINTDGTLGDFRAETPVPVSDNFNYIKCFVIKDKLYAIGGDNYSYIYKATVNNDGTLSNWESVYSFSLEVGYSTPLIIKDRIYIFGLNDADSGARQIYYSTYDSDGNIGSWTYVSDMPNNIYGSTMVCTDNYVFSIGDINSSASYRAPILADGSIGTWTQISAPPVSTTYGQVAIAGNKIYFIGGYNYYYDSAIDNYSYRYLNSVYVATFTSGITDYTPYYTDQSSASTTPSSPVKKSAGIPWQSQWGFNSSTQNDITNWSSTNNLTDTVSDAASLVTKSYIYILGGYSRNSAINTIQRASFDSDGNLSSSWSNVGTLPISNESMGYIATKGRFYLIGGNSSSGYLTTVYSTSINTDGSLGDFRSETPLPNKRHFPVCFVIKEKLYVVGGMDENVKLTNTVYKAIVNNDGSLTEWTTLPNFPTSFYSGTPLLIKDRIYIFGLNDDSSNPKNYYTTYDSDGNIGSWTYVSDMPNNIGFSAIVCTDNYVFSIGGYDYGNNKSTNAAYRAPILSDGSIGSWTQISDLPIAAGFAQLVIAGNKIYYIGGYNGSTYLNTVYSATFTSGITDYTPYYTDQQNTSSTSSTFCLPDLTSRSNTSPRMKYIIKT